MVHKEITDSRNKTHADTKGGRRSAAGRRVGDHPQYSAIHWTGPNISIDRILYCTEKTNGQLCEAVIKRERWVEHLQRRAEHTAETCNKFDTSA
eukprot:scaffold24239_cov209-Skeletonema_marinoi.AAC.1